MLTTFDKIKHKKGQGIVEYALLLAFIVGIAIMLNGADLGGALKGTFDKVASAIGGETKENAYVAGFKKWSSMKKSDLENEDAAARLAADQAALDNIAKTLYKLTRDQVAGLTGQDIKEGRNNTFFYGTTSGTNDGTKGDEYGDNKFSTLLLNYYDSDSANTTGINLNYKPEVYLNTGWLQGTNGADNSNKSQWTSTNTSTRYFYSDGMIHNDYGSQVRAQFHVGSDGKVDSVRVFAVQNRNKDAGVTRFTQIEGLDRTYDSNGAHATN